MFRPLDISDELIIDDLRSSYYQCPYYVPFYWAMVDDRMFDEEAGDYFVFHINEKDIQMFSQLSGKKGHFLLIKEKRDGKIESVILNAREYRKYQHDGTTPEWVTVHK